MHHKQLRRLKASQQLVLYYRFLTLYLARGTYCSAEILDIIQQKNKTELGRVKIRKHTKFHYKNRKDAKQQQQQRQQ